MKNDLTKTLRKIIREEVEKAVRTEFVNFVSLMGEAKTPKKKVIKKPKKKVVSETSIKKMVDDIVPAKEQVSFTKDPVLNSILNETKGGVPVDGTIPQQPQQGQEEWPTMGGEGKTFDRNSMAEMLGYGGGVPTIQGMSTPDGKPVSAEQVPDSVVNAMTRNYGDLMKAIDKKKQGAPLKG
tara:strand:+ start:664 stop:1206 length:543 start_codon:yes stop_codon:yes gene_type:complete